MAVLAHLARDQSVAPSFTTHHQRSRRFEQAQQQDCGNSSPLWAGQNASACAQSTQLAHTRAWRKI